MRLVPPNIERPWNKFDSVIRQVLRLCLYVFIFLPICFFPYLALRNFEISQSRFLAFSIVLLFLSLSFYLYERIRPVYELWLEQTLFPEGVNYKKLLDDATRRIAKIKSPRRLFSLVIHFVTMSLSVKNAAVLVKDLKGVFRLAHQRGYQELENIGLSLDGRNPIISFLDREKSPLDLDQIEVLLKNSMRRVNQSHLSYPFEVIHQELTRLRAVSIIPSFYGKELKSILLIGYKKDGKKLSEKEIDILFHLSEDTAIAIENARLYDEALGKGKKLEQINRELHDASRKLIHALNETEEANKRLQDTQAQLLHEQKMVTLGRLASSVGHEINNPLTILSMNVSRIILKYRKDPELKVEDVLDFFKKIEANIQRIQAVVNTLTGLLRRHEKGRMKPLSLKIVLEETLPLVRFQTYMDNLSGTEVEFDMPTHIPLIRGDLERLQEVFLNLFINSLHAMQGSQNRKISVRAETDAEDPKMVVISFTDNGVGMPEEVMKKIFNFRFTTKQEGKGSGIGLYMCKYIVEIHGGQIKVQSKPGQGTTFKIILPVYEEMEHAEAVNH